MLSLRLMIALSSIFLEGSVFGSAIDAAINDEIQNVQHPSLTLLTPQIVTLILHEQELYQPEPPSPWLSLVVPWNEIASYLNYKTKIHHVNHYLFTAVTTYPVTDISKKGFAHLNTLPRLSGCILKDLAVNFRRHSSENIPSYILYSLVNEARYLKQHNWPSLKKTRINTLMLKSCRIGDAGIIALSKILPETCINTLNLDTNDIGLEGFSSLTRVLPLTMIRVLDIRNNYLGCSGIIALTQILPSTLIDTIHMSKKDFQCEGFADLNSLTYLAEILALDLKHLPKTSVVKNISWVIHP